MNNTTKKILLSILIAIVISAGLIFMLEVNSSRPKLSTRESVLVENNLDLKDDYKQVELPEILDEKTKSIIKDNTEFRTKILATGDIIYHQPLYSNNFDKDIGEYTFNTFYQKTQELMSSADLVIGNFESTINPNRELSGFPTFNAPLEAAKALKSDGFDILSTANNHCLDTGIQGIETTIEALDKAGIKHFGTYTDAYEPLIVESNGIKIGFLAFSEIFNGLDSMIKSDDAHMISPMDEELIINRINEIKMLGADFIVVYPHWGWEYSKNTSNTQEYFNDLFIENGVDAVLGSHPHVLQKSQEITKDNKKIFTIYSMGNSISNQRYQWLNEPGVESGVFVEINILKTAELTTIEEVILHPTYVNRYIDDQGKFQSEVILYKDIIDGGKFRENLDSYTKTFVDENYKDSLKRLNIGTN